MFNHDLNVYIIAIPVDIKCISLYFCGVSLVTFKRQWSGSYGLFIKFSPDSSKYLLSAGYPAYISRWYPASYLHLPSFHSFLFMTSHRVIKICQNIVQPILYVTALPLMQLIPELYNYLVLVCKLYTTFHSVSWLYIWWCDLGTRTGKIKEKI